MRIGILALQGAFIEHAKMLDLLHVDHFEIRQKKDLDHSFDGLILPGGESTVMGKLLHDLNLFDDIKSKIEQGTPAFGTCAGLILLANKISNDDKIHLATMPVTVNRNAYGRQLGSFESVAPFEGIGEIPLTFIRAPYIETVEGDTKVLSVVDGHIVAAQYKNQLGVAFHPELTNSTAVHEYFVNMVKQHANKN